MFELACDRTFVEEVKTTIDVKTGAVSKIEKSRKHIPPSPVLLIFLAKNRMRDRYKETTHLLKQSLKPIRNNQMFRFICRRMGVR